MDRDEFMELVYETFAEEPDNVLANGIIEAADAYVEHEKAQLSQEGTTKDATSDLISRQAAIDALQNCRKHCIDPFDSYHIDIQDAENQLSNLPPAQPEPQWIPVSERLPEEHESMFAKYYNTPKWSNSMWLKESDKMFVSVEVPGNEIIVDTAKMLDGKWFFGLSFVDKKVIAWMPLPEPYKPNK